MLGSGNKPSKWIEYAFGIHLIETDPIVLNNDLNLFRWQILTVHTFFVGLLELDGLRATHGDIDNGLDVFAPIFERVFQQILEELFQQYLVSEYGPYLVDIHRASNFLEQELQLSAYIGYDFSEIHRSWRQASPIQPRIG